MKKQFLLFIMLVSCSISGMAQTNKVAEDSVYRAAIQDRSWKIVQKLQLNDSAKAIQLREVIAAQYISLNEVYTKRDVKEKEIKSNSLLNKEAKQDSMNKNQLTSELSVAKLHKPYLKKLSHLLNKEQVVAVKDGMTYGVVPLTYGAYMEMLPQLTAPQKKQIMEWLVEAREKAMDAESSKKKHAWFGKYKGRINNYLSAAGIDMKKEGEAWQERIKARSANH
ncbi:DUF3826 domain-containing protein [Pedobacter sp. AW31-3R]|uniref:DUF3826 domain-containing protein n=1 Tax=Pedobacter sp. AW31-3R TaxID=3445781 RepID=UPI003F9FD9AB